jgi:hypothetical protein
MPRGNDCRAFKVAPKTNYAVPPLAIMKTAGQAILLQHLVTEADFWSRQRSSVSSA